MPTGIKGKFPIHFRVAFELRYRAGYTYLDRCGRTINLIQGTHPDWILPQSSQPTPQAAVLVSTESSCRFSFSSTRLDFGIVKPIGQTEISATDHNLFAKQVDELTSIVVDQLTLTDFSRIGLRMWLLFPFQEMSECRLWLREIGLFSVAPAIADAFDGELQDVSFAVVISGKDRKFRIGGEIIERAVTMDLGDAVMNVSTHMLSSKKDDRRETERFKALRQKQKVKKILEQNPPFGVMLDVDVFQEDPEVIRPGDFVTTSLSQVTERLKKAIEGANHA